LSSEVSECKPLVTGHLVITPATAKKPGGALVPRAAGRGAAGGPMVVVLLDEMDQLVSKAQGILYELFGLPTLGAGAYIRPLYSLS